jgi:hypothetical protein
MRLAQTLAAAALLLAAPARAGNKAERPLPSGRATVTDSPGRAEERDDARKLAEAYLQAIAHQGTDGAVETLLGGATLTARLYSLENWKVVGRENHRREEGELGDLNGYVDAIDRAGRNALAAMMGGGPGKTDQDGLGVSELTAEDAKKILAPTRAKATQFARTHPVFAYLARVDKQVYWHPKNPFRKLLADAGTRGRYACDLDLFWVETVEGRHEDKQTRKWPLRVVRFRASGTDTGLKILPASDWNAE